MPELLHVPDGCWELCALLVMRSYYGPTPEMTCTLGELWAHLVILELLRHPTPELTCTLNADNGQGLPTDRPGNRPGIQGKLPVRHAGSG
jgi:hypothetical protein